jgi:hypothetical protein
MKLLQATLLALSAVTVCTVARPAIAQEAKAKAKAEVSSESPGLFSNFSIRLGGQAAGPLLFQDTPDGTVEDLSVFQVGPRIAFLFGHELKDLHRVGLGFTYDFVAKSETRSLGFVAPHLQYEIGHPLVLQAALGGNIGVGTKGFASNYSGLHTGVALRWSFLDEDRWSPVAVSPGIAARANVVPGDMQYTSVFLGAQLEIMYLSNN